jgi:hypothetical protein
MERQRRCRCNGRLMLPQRVSSNVVSYWCPHMQPLGKVDVERQIAWQKLNKVPDWLCKVRSIPTSQPIPEGWS